MGVSPLRPPMWQIHGPSLAHEEGLPGREGQGTGAKGSSEVGHDSIAYSVMKRCDLRAVCERRIIVGRGSATLLRALNPAHTC